jgi:predicted nucleic acid-binding protein
VAESWVINASPTILLAKAGLMPLVPKLISELVIPEPVVSEILNAGPSDPAAIWFKNHGKPFIRPAVAELPGLAGSGIGIGERAVISWAGTHSGFIAVLDDLEARVTAQRLGIKIIGTVGVILRLKETHLISEAKLNLEKVRAVGGYISDDLFRQALRHAGEKP